MLKLSVMKRRLVAYMLLAGFCGIVSADSIRIATLNVDNYLVMNRHVDGQWRPSYPKPETEKAAIRESILEAKPDVLVLQEMGGLNFLEELRADLFHEGFHYPYAVHFKAQDDERHLAVLSLLPPRQVKKHTDMDFKYFDRREKVKRGLLEMSFDLADGLSFRLYAVHLKSRWTEDKADPEANLRRTREAEACRNRIIERSAEEGSTLYCVAGDFNSDPNSAPMRRFYRRGKLQIGVRVPATDSRGEVWTYFYAKKAIYSTVDGFVASPALMKMVRGGQGTIMNGPNQLSGSDHRMVYIDLDVAPAAVDAN